MKLRILLLAFVSSIPLFAGICENSQCRFEDPEVKLPVKVESPKVAKPKGECAESKKSIPAMPVEVPACDKACGDKGCEVEDSSPDMPVSQISSPPVCPAKCRCLELCVEDCENNCGKPDCGCKCDACEIGMCPSTSRHQG